MLDPNSAVPPAPVLRRLMSLSGLVPLGAFLFLHVAFNAAALGGGVRFSRVVNYTHRLPAFAVFEALFVFVPLAVHASLGLWLWLSRAAPHRPSAYPPNLRLALRATGVVAALFMAMHLPELRLGMAGARLDGGELSTVLAADLSSTWHGVPSFGVAYLFGTACVVFHFAVGSWGFFAASRSGRESPAQRTAAAWAAGAGGIMLWMVIANLIVFHATGAALFGGPGIDSSVTPSVPCPNR